MPKLKRAIKIDKPYKRSVSAVSVIEDVELATKNYPGSKYEMILVAAMRSRQLAQGEDTLLPTDVHKPCVTSILEIQGKYLK